MPSVTKYHITARIFHWVGALLILFAWILSDLGGEFIGLHKAVGFSFLIWTILRILNRLVTKTPNPLPMPAWQLKASRMTHLALYVVMLAMPLSGFLAALFGGYGVDVFGFFYISGFSNPDRYLARLLMEIHEDIMWNALIGLVALHIAAALFHQFIMKDDILQRMR